MKNKILFTTAFLMLSGCSSSVRPLHSNTDDVSEAMMVRANALGLQLSDTSTPALAKAIVQAEEFCAITHQTLQVNVVQKDRGGTMVPVVHMKCK